MKNCVFSLLVLLIGMPAGRARSQGYTDLVKITYQNTPLNSFKNSVGKTRVAEFAGELVLPIKVSNKTYLINNIQYEQSCLRLSESGNYESVRAITLRTGLMWKHSKKITGTYLVVPRVASDLNSSLADGFQIGGLVLFKIARSAQSNIKLGLFASTEFFSPFVTPLLGYYRISDNNRWEVNALLPASFSITRNFSSRLSASLGFNGQIKGYWLDEVHSTGNPGYLVRANNDICTSLSLMVFKNFYMQLRTGISLGRSYRVYNEHDKLNFAISFIKFDNNRMQLNTDFSNGWVGQVGIFYRIPAN